jgi:hypothetical protein
MRLKIIMLERGLGELSRLKYLGENSVSCGSKHNNTRNPNSHIQGATNR